MNIIRLVPDDQPIPDPPGSSAAAGLVTERGIPWKYSALEQDGDGYIVRLLPDDISPFTVANQYTVYLQAQAVDISGFDYQTTDSNPFLNVFLNSTSSGFQAKTESTYEAGNLIWTDGVELVSWDATKIYRDGQIVAPLEAAYSGLSVAYKEGIYLSIERLSNPDRIVYYFFNQAGDVLGTGTLPLVVGYAPNGNSLNVESAFINRDLTKAAIIYSNDNVEAVPHEEGEKRSLLEHVARYNIDIDNYLVFETSSIDQRTSVSESFPSMASELYVYYDGSNIEQSIIVSMNHRTMGEYVGFSGNVDGHAYSSIAGVTILSAVMLVNGQKLVAIETDTLTLDGVLVDSNFSNFYTISNHLRNHRYREAWEGDNNDMPMSFIWDRFGNRVGISINLGDEKVVCLDRNNNITNDIVIDNFKVPFNDNMIRAI